MKAYCIQQLETIEQVSINGVTDIPLETTAPHVVSVTVSGIKSEVLLHALEDRGVFVSSGSACSSNHPALSGTLQAIGLNKAAVESTIRLSFSCFTTKEEIDYAIQEMKAIIPMLRKYIKK